MYVKELQFCLLLCMGVQHGRSYWGRNVGQPGPLIPFNPISFRPTLILFYLFPNHLSIHDKQNYKRTCANNAANNSNVSYHTVRSVTCKHRNMGRCEGRYVHLVTK